MGRRYISKFFFAIEGMGEAMAASGSVFRLKPCFRGMLHDPNAKQLEGYPFLRTARKPVLG